MAAVHAHLRVVGRHVAFAVWLTGVLGGCFPILYLIRLI